MLRGFRSMDTTDLNPMFVDHNRDAYSPRWKVRSSAEKSLLLPSSVVLTLRKSAKRGAAQKVVVQAVKNPNLGQLPIVGNRSR